MNVPDNLKYTKEHEWVKIEDGVALVGVTDYAQSEMGDVVFVEMPEPGETVEQFAETGTIESVKVASDFFSPLSGTVEEINEKLADSPETVNSDPYGEGWILKIKLSDESEAAGLLSPDEYRAIVS
ncbi:MAG: glycine cleavage system protein GcvH [Fibrobacterota bacterium]